MSWLVRMEMDAEDAIAGEMVDTYAWHQKLWECFPHNPEKKRDFLTRIDTLEGAFRLWLLAPGMPERPNWCAPENFTLKEIASSFLSHRYYSFDLRANPIMTRVVRGPNGETLYRPNGKRSHGKRIPIVDPDMLREWIIRKGTARCKDDTAGADVSGGFKIVEEKPLEIRPMVEHHFRKNEHRGFHGGVQFRGTLEVTDSKSFSETYHRGVGSAKGFGFGLLLLAPVTL